MFSLGLSEKAAADHHQIATHPQRDSSTWPWGHSKAALINSLMDSVKEMMEGQMGQSSPEAEPLEGKQAHTISQRYPG